ncbi:MAG: hypothetical protein K0R75_1453 [Paenibacillaceae bacterium]|nr:hypothetical protein [Paenibacillaceae bacterium]
MIVASHGGRLVAVHTTGSTEPGLRTTSEHQLTLKQTDPNHSRTRFGRGRFLFGQEEEGKMWYATLEEWRLGLNGTYIPYYYTIGYLRTYNGTQRPYLFFAA